MSEENKCIQGKSECQFWAGGYCLPLNDTYFVRNCPFYKPVSCDYSAEYHFDAYPYEKFRWVHGVGSNYLVSDLGTVINKHGRRINYRKDRHGNAAVYVSHATNYILLRVDKLVLESFQPEVPVPKKILHIDGDALNCALNNLRRP